jgi:putative endonuclease
LKLIDINTYYVYIVTDREKKALETGVAGALNIRLSRLALNAYTAMAEAQPYCMYLLYWEKYTDVQEAMVREEKIKKMTRSKKDELISASNPEWRFLNEEVL